MKNKTDFIGQSVKGKVIAANYSPSGGMLEIDLLNEEDRETFKLESLVLRFSYPPVLPVLVGDEIIALIKKPVAEYSVMHPEERPYLIRKSHTFFNLC